MMIRFAFVLALLVGTLSGGARALHAAELIMFDDPNCVWCRRWHAEIGPSYPNSEEGQLAPLRRVHIRDQSNAGIALRRPVTGTPTFVLVENEQEVGRIDGYPGSDFFYPRLAELLKRLPPPAPPARRPPQRSTTCLADGCRAR
jgi:hypothetical protein